MKNLKALRLGLGVLFSGFMMLVLVSSSTPEIIEIQVSPNVLNLQNQGQVVTVHTEIAYFLVDAETVYMNGIEISSWKADNQGNFVAKFLMDEIVGLPLEIGEYNELTLEGLKTDGTSFTGTDQIMVINVSKKGKE
jgi:hypothetical protein